MRVAVTGGFGSGKSTVTALLKKKGAVIVDSDLIVHDLLAGDRAVRASIRKKFGPEAFSADGRVNRAFLAKTIFSEPKRRLALEAIIHPAVRRLIRVRSRGVRTQPVVIDIPLLFETGWKEKFEAVIVVSASAARRLKRLRGRGFSQAEARRRMRAQMPLAMKARKADYVIDNNGTIQKTEKQIDEIWQKLTVHKDVARGKNGFTSGR